MRKITAVIIAGALALGLAGCSKVESGPQYVNCAWFIADDGYLAPFLCEEEK